MAVKALQFIHAVARKLLAKPTKPSEGLTSIANRMQAEAKASEIAETFRLSGLTPDKWDDFIKSEADVKKYLNIIESMKEQSITRKFGKTTDERFDSLAKYLEKRDTLFGPEKADVLDLSGKKIDTSKPILGGKNVPETESEILKRIKNQNKETVANINQQMIEEDRAIKDMYRTTGGGTRTLDEDAGYLAEFLADDAGKFLDDLPKAEQTKFYDRAYKALVRHQKKKLDPEDFAYGGVAGMLGEPTYADENHRVPYEKAGKVDLSAILKGIFPEREPPQLRENFTGQGGPMGRPKSPGGLQEVVDIQESIKADKGEQNKVLGVLNYVIDNADQELAENMILTLGEGVKISAQTTMSGYKQDLFEKAGIVPIDGETLYQAVIDTDLFNKFNLDATAVADAVGTQELLGSLKYNNLGLTWNSATGQMDGEWKFEKRDGPANQETSWTLTPKLSKNDIANSQEASITFDKAVNSGNIQFSASDKAHSGGENKRLKFNWTGKKGEDGKAETIDISHLTRDGDKTLKFDGVKSFDFYNIDGKNPRFSLESTHNLDKGDENYLASAVLPLPFDTSLYGKKGSDQESSWGVGYEKDWEFDNPFTKEKGGDNKGIFSIKADANLASGDKDVMFNLRVPLSSNKLRKQPLNFDNYNTKPSLIKDHVWVNGELVFMPEKQQFEYKQAKEQADEYEYYRSTSDVGEAYNIYKTKDWIPKERMHMPMRRDDMADGGIARLGFKDGSGMSRRGFLKLAAGLATIPLVGKYFKWAKPLAKSSKVLTSVPIKSGADGMPLWFKPLVNKVIKEGDDVTKKFATAEREIVHKTKLPDSQTDVIVTQNLDSGNVSVELGMTKHGFPDGHLGQPVRLEYKAAEDIMTGPDMDAMFKTGMKKEPHVKTKTKTKEEFWVEEAEFSGGHPENVKFEESTFEKFGDHGSNFDEVEKFATGKVKKKKPLKKSGWGDEGDHNPDVDFASGGRVPMWLGGGLTAGKRTVSELLKYMSKGSSHGKTPSEMLNMINPKQFNEMLNRPEGIPSIAKEMIEKYTKEMKIDRARMIEDLIGTGRRIKKVDDNLVNHKIKIIEDMVSKGVDRKIAKEMADNIAEMASSAARKKATPKITDRGLLEMENIQKNLATKDRKLNASGGLAGMLGE